MNITFIFIYECIFYIEYSKIQIYIMKHNVKRLSRLVIRTLKEAIGHD